MDDRAWLLTSVPAGRDRSGAELWFAVVLAAWEQADLASFAERLPDLAGEHGFAATDVESFLAGLFDRASPEEVLLLLDRIGPGVLAGEHGPADDWHWDGERGEWLVREGDAWRRQVTEDGYWKLDESRTAWVPVEPAGTGAPDPDEAAVLDRFLTEVLERFAAALPALARRLRLSSAEVAALVAAIPADEVAETITGAVLA